MCTAIWAVTVADCWVAPGLCSYCSRAQDGPTVRFVSALAAPVFPLLVLLCCALVELMKPGLGINTAIQATYLPFSAFCGVSCLRM